MTRHPAREQVYKVTAEAAWFNPARGDTADPRPWRLWIDMETSGLDPEHDYVLEAAAVLQHPRGLDHASVWVLNTQIVAAAGKAKRSKVAKLMPPVVADMHTRNGLIDDLCHTQHLGDTINGGTWPWTVHLVNDEAGIDAALCDLLSDVPENDKVTIAGSGVAHFDVAWMRDQGWQLPERCTYWQHDVGTVRRWLQGSGIPIIDAPLSSGPGKRHRAVDDVLAHMDEDRTLTELVHGALCGGAA